MATVARTYRVNAKRLEEQYKEHLSDYRQWNQQEHAEDWVLAPQNIGTRLSLDETAIHKDELYTVLTNKTAKGKKGALITMVKGTRVRDVATILSQIPAKQRNMVKEVTVDMAENMMAMARAAFPNATIVTDRFHVQKLVTEGLQDVRITLRKAAMEQENKERKSAKAEGRDFRPHTHTNGDTEKQLLARSRYLLFKSSGKWTERQRERATILWKRYPTLKTAYDLSMAFRGFYEHSTTVEDGRKRLRAWVTTVETKMHTHEELHVFRTPMETIQGCEQTILNYFLHRSTNASAESFNAKLKGFRALVRGVQDIPFFLYRVMQLYG